MEIVLYGLLTAIFWTAATTVLLPLTLLLKYNKNAKSLWFAYLFSVVLKPILQRRFLPSRKKIFQLLDDKLSGRDVTKPLKVLEIGIGAGNNLEFYPRNSHLTALDLNVNFYPFFKRNQEKYPQVFYDRTVISPAENMKDIDDASMDVVISTLVMCSVTSMKDALGEIRRVLKPGGTFLFLEHVGYPKTEWEYTIQNVMSPLWNIYGGGCCLTRSAGDTIKNSGFSDVVCDRIYPKNVWLYTRPLDYGLATK